MFSIRLTSDFATIRIVCYNTQTYGPNSTHDNRYLVLKQGCNGHSACLEGNMGVEYPL